jgi:hypothetical protein
MVRPMPGRRSPRPERHTEHLPPAEVQPLPLTVADADVELLPAGMDPAVLGYLSAGRHNRENLVGVPATQ